ncbi:hypothetical protein C8Q76DRAFT_584958, partial [Earliella scabrosa]
RKPSRWNAFLSLEMEKRNAALPDGAERKRVSEDNLAKEIGVVWRAMSKEEQIAATEARMNEIVDRRTSRQKAIPTLPVQIFHDTRATLANIEHELKGLNVRTGVDVLFIAVKSGPFDYQPPYVFYTHTRIAEFIKFTAKNTVMELAKRMEGYCISGVTGLKQSYRQNILFKRSEASRIINGHMGKSSCRRGALTRMVYINFDTHVTGPHRLLCKGWPLLRFRAPGEISSPIELELLIDAWTSGTCYLYKMTDEEYHDW